MILGLHILEYIAFAYFLIQWLGRMARLGVYALSPFDRIMAGYKKGDMVARFIGYGVQLAFIVGIHIALWNIIEGIPR